MVMVAAARDQGVGRSAGAWRDMESLSCHAFRATRRRAAVARKEKELSQLKARLQCLETELNAWWSWWWQAKHWPKEQEQEDLCPTSQNLEVPFAERTDSQLLAAVADSDEVSLLLECGETKDNATEDAEVIWDGTVEDLREELRDCNEGDGEDEVVEELVDGADCLETPAGVLARAIVGALDNERLLALTRSDTRGEMKWLDEIENDTEALLLLKASFAAVCYVAVKDGESGRAGLSLGTQLSDPELKAVAARVTARELVDDDGGLWDAGFNEVVDHLLGELEQELKVTVQPG